MGIQMDAALDFEPIIKRKLAWDIIPCSAAADFLPRLGLIPGSDGGNDQEHRQSHHRLNQTAPIDSAVKLFSGLAGEIAGRAILESQGHEIENDSDPQLQHYRDVVSACSQAVVANLIESGLVRINEGMF